MRESQQLADFVASTNFKDLPGDIVDRVKTYVLDSLAAGLVGSRLPWSQIVHDVEREKGSAGVCSIFGSKTRMSASSAAYVNGTMAGAFEAEHNAHIAHPGGVLVPAALAAAEASGTSGRDLILACVMGYEVVCRVGDAQTRLVEDVRGFHNPAVNGPFSSAAAVGKVLGLDAENQLNAFGIAGSMSCGLTEFAWNGAMTKRLHIGLASRSGLEAAYLASRGFTGPGTVLEGPFGYLNAFSPAPKPELLAAELGTVWMTRDINIKQYAAHGSLQAIIAALQEFKAAESFDPADVRAVHVRASPVRMLQKRFLDPSPRSLLQAQLSMPFVVAVALYRDLSDPLRFDESALTDASINALAATVTWEEIETDHPAIAFLEITIGGRTHEVFAGDYRGSATRPAQWEHVVDKFHRYSRHVLDEKRRERVVETVRSLDALASVGELMSRVRA